MKEKIYQYKILGKRRTKCPKCGKLGVLSRFKGENRGGTCTHTYKRIKIYGLSVDEIVDSCFFSAEELNKLGL
jgi:ribosomal protein S27AE